MNIKVHKIEENDYCSLFDVIKIRAQKLKNSVIQLNELRAIYNDINIYLHICNPVEDDKDSIIEDCTVEDETVEDCIAEDETVEDYIAEDEIVEDCIVGDETVGDENRALKNHKPQFKNTFLLEQKVYFLSKSFSYVKLTKLPNGIYNVAIKFEKYCENDFQPLMENDTASVKRFIIERTLSSHYSLEIFKPYLGYLWEQGSVPEYTGVPKDNLHNLYILLTDARIYLADCITDDNYYFAKHETIESNLSTELSTEKPLYLDNSNPNYSPYLAIAIDIWTKVFINGEIRKNKGRISQFKDLIEKYYPNITSESVKKEIAQIGVTHKGKKIEDIKN